MALTRTPTTPLKSHKKIAEALGKLCGDWSLLEMLLMSIFVACIGGKPAPTRAAYYALNNHRAQRDMVVAAAEVALSDTQELADLKDTIAEITKLSSDRARYVHSPYVGDSTKLRRLETRSKTNEMKSRQIQLKELVETTDRICEAGAQLIEHYVVICGKLGTLPDESIWDMS